MVQDVQTVQTVQDVGNIWNDLNYWNGWNCILPNAALDNQPKNRIEGQKESPEGFAMNVLITGGMGGNGAGTARLLVREGIRPVLMDNRREFFVIKDIKDRVDCVEADICDQQALEKTVDVYKITHIAHLAALMPEPAEANPRLGIKVGVDGTTNVLEVARAKQIKRVVFTSSKAVYGEILGDH